MNWTTIDYTDEVTGEKYSYEVVGFPEWADSFWQICVWPSENEPGRYHEGSYWPGGDEHLMESHATIEQAKAAAEARAKKQFTERFTELARALGGRVLDVAVDEALLVYDDGLCPECNDGKSRIDWNTPSDPVNDLYSCGLHNFHPNDLEVLATEKQFGPGRILLVHFPEPENEEAQ